jgi:hypothetical protein
MTAVVALVLVVAVPARAGLPDSFTACARVGKGDPCERSIAVEFGTTVTVTATVAPPHANLEAAVWHQDTAGVWERLDRVEISDRGCMRYEWRTTAADGSQTDPNHLQFRIPDHGKSNKVEVMVYFGE